MSDPRPRQAQHMAAMQEHTSYVQLMTTLRCFVAGIVQLLDAVTSPVRPMSYGTAGKCCVYRGLQA
jgi:hypothetical protein